MTLNPTVMTMFRQEFPNIHPSLEALPKNSKIRELYPEDIFPGGGYLTLPYGRTRYWLFGPEDGTKVVLIHGLTIPAITWQHVAPVLSSKGFRVLTYDFYGKGYSEAPEVPYDANLFTVQLALLMQYVKWDKANIVGFSMGGGVTAAFTTSFPHLCEKLVFIASAGVPDRNSELAASNANPIPSMAEIRRLQGESLPGYDVAIESIKKVGPLRGLLPAFGWIAHHDPPFKVLIIHGTVDAVVPYGNGKILKGVIKHAEFFPVEGAAHDLLVLQPFAAAVVDKLASFLEA